MSRSRRARLAEGAVVAAFVLLVAWPWLRPDRHVMLFDTVAYTGPNLEEFYAKFGFVAHGGLTMRAEPRARPGDA